MDDTTNNILWQNRIPLDVVFYILSFDHRFSCDVKTNQRLKEDTFWKYQKNMWYGPLRLVSKSDNHCIWHKLETERPVNENGHVLFPRRDGSQYLRRLIYDEFEYMDENGELVIVSKLTYYLTMKYFDYFRDTYLVELFYYETTMR